MTTVAVSARRVRVAAEAAVKDLNDTQRQIFDTYNNAMAKLRSAPRARGDYSAINLTLSVSRQVEPFEKRRRQAQALVNMAELAGDEGCVQLDVEDAALLGRYIGSHP